MTATANQIFPVHKDKIEGSTLLSNHGYSLGSIIGRGAFSTVRVAGSKRHSVDRVAIKIIAKYQAPMDLIHKFLPREISVVKGLRHSHVIKFFLAIESTHRVYIIMEYAERGSLLALLRRHGAVGEVKAKIWFHQLADAVLFCHKNGVVHRDIKCENILLSRNYDIKLSDFGFAKGKMHTKYGQYPVSRTFCGSYAYASPEILRAEQYRPHLADVWAMGVVLFAMVYGTLPFDDSNYRELIKQVERALVLPRSPSISSTLKLLFDKVFLPETSRVTVLGILKDTWLQAVPNEKTKMNLNLERTVTK